MLVIEGRAYLQGRIEPRAIGVEDGTIVAIKKQLRGDPVYRYGDALILPGGIDVHVHFREPGMTHKDDFSSGTESAAAGGVTTVVDMPNTKPPVTTPEALQQKMRLASRSANVDFGLYASPASARDVESLRDASALKMYLAETTNAPAIPSFDVAGGILAAAAGTGLHVSAHCEDPRLFGKGIATSLAEHDRVRSTRAEASAIAELGKHRGTCPLHIAHVTNRDALDARPDGVTCEVTPHHLLLDVTSKLGARAKVNPPLRTPTERTNLLQAVLDGRVDMFASDHAPHTLEEKSVRFEDAPAGMPGVATTFPLMFRYVRRQLLPLERFVAMFAENPAKLLRVNKGVIEVGRDADLVVVDPRRIEPVTATRCRYKCGWTPFEGAEGTFPIATFVRGQLVAQEGELVTERIGRMITRAKP
jgi:dihydroorotase